MLSVSEVGCTAGLGWTICAAVVFPPLLGHLT
jgi:hypothetical protein